MDAERLKNQFVDDLHLFKEQFVFEVQYLHRITETRY